MRNPTPPAIAAVAGKAAVVVVVALLVLSGAMVGPTTAATSTTVELDRALEDQTETSTVSFTFTASTNQTVEADTYAETTDENVDFRFDGWSSLDSSASGSSAQWDVVAGEEYRVVYEAQAQSGASEGQHSGSVYVEGIDEWFDLEVTVDLLEPDLRSIPDAETTVVFEDPDEATGTLTVDVTNYGDGVMVLDGSSFTTPSGIEVSEPGSLGRVDPGETRELEFDVTVDSRVSPGQKSITGTVTESLGGSASFDGTVDVRKPPVASVSGGEVDLGDLLVNTTTTTKFTVVERAGFEGLDGLETNVVRQQLRTDLSIDSGWNFGTTPGGSDEAEATIEVGDLEQHEELSWTVEMSGTDEDSPTRRVEFVGRAIYPARLGEIDVGMDRFYFDEPKDSGTVSRTAVVDLPNDGDLEMDVTSVSASVASSTVDGNRNLDVEVLDRPDVVEGLETGKATLRFDADTELPEGTYTLVLDVETAEAGDRRIEHDFRVEHGIELSLQETGVELGEVSVSERRTRSIDVGETLGYKDLDDLEVEIVEGPDDWLEITSRPPSRLDAGDAAPVVVALTFDTEATAYEQYDWVIEVDADGVDAQRITVSAMARLLSVEDIVTDLEDRSTDGWQADLTGGTIDGLEGMEDRLRSGEEFAGSDILRAVAIGQSNVVLVDSIEAAQSHQTDGEYDRAQRELVSARTTYNLLAEYVDELEDERSREHFGAALAVADESLEDVTERQRTHYHSRLEDEELSAIEQARINDHLAQLAELEGETDAAETFTAASDEEFERYHALVEEGTASRQQARDEFQAFEADATLSILGQPLEIDPRRLSEVDRRADGILTDYDRTVDAYAAAGATAETSAVRAERESTSRQLLIARYGLYAATGLLALAFVLVVVVELRNAAVYVRESGDAATGDFLL